MKRYLKTAFQLNVHKYRKAREKFVATTVARKNKRPLSKEHDFKFKEMTEGIMNTENSTSATEGITKFK